MQPFNPSTHSEKVTRKFLVTVSVVVDDANNPEYKKQMDEVEAWLFNPMKRAASSLDAGSNRLSVDVQRQKDA